MQTLRQDLEDIRNWAHSMGHSFPLNRAATALVCLDNSREITEKVTTSQSRGWGVPENRRFIVTNHKARVVLDD